VRNIHYNLSTYIKYQSIAVIVLAFWLTGASAQVTSVSISGTVQYPTGAAITGAEVKLNNPATGVQRAVFTSRAGVSVAPNLPPGAYTITVEAKGFKTLVKTPIFLSAADRLNSGICTLEVGGTTDTITVTADSGQLQLQANSGERSEGITSALSSLEFRLQAAEIRPPKGGTTNMAGPTRPALQSDSSLEFRLQAAEIRPPESRTKTRPDLRDRLYNPILVWSSAFRRQKSDRLKAELQTWPDLRDRLYNPILVWSSAFRRQKSDRLKAELKHGRTYATGSTIQL
jgi:carboxypeptidase family protein